MSTRIEWASGGDDTEAMDWKPLERFPAEFSVEGWDVILIATGQKGVITAVCIPQEDQDISKKRTITYNVSELPNFNMWLNSASSKKHPVFRFIGPTKEPFF